MLYLDTSLITALVTTEGLSAAASDWLVAVDDPLVTSEWALTEVASALSIKQRRGELDRTTRVIAERSVARLLDDAVEVVPVLQLDFRAAADFVRPPQRALRGGDAVHLAVVGRLGATLHTLDHGQAEAARDHGLDAVITVERE